jgi:hypothetical protein
VRPLSRYVLRAVHGAGAQAGGSPAEQIDHGAVFTGLASGTDPVSGFGLGGRHSGHLGTNALFSSDRGMGAFAEPRLTTTDWATSPAVATTSYFSVIAASVRSARAALAQSSSFCTVGAPLNPIAPTMSPST